MSFVGHKRWYQRSDSSWVKKYRAPGGNDFSLGSTKNSCYTRQMFYRLYALSKLNHDQL